MFQVIHYGTGLRAGRDYYPAVTQRLAKDNRAPATVRRQREKRPLRPSERHLVPLAATSAPTRTGGIPRRFLDSGP
jgi:hypothetical protein